MLDEARRETMGEGIKDGKLSEMRWGLRVGWARDREGALELIYVEGVVGRLIEGC